MTDQAVTPDAIAEPLIDPVELEAIFAEILDALVMSVGMDLDEPIEAVPGIEASSVTGSIVIHADTEARLVVDSDAQACARLARCWGLIGPDGATLQDANDALGELCNIVGATAKTVFDEESHVGIPEVAAGATLDGGTDEVTVYHSIGVFVARFGLNQG